MSKNLKIQIIYLLISCFYKAKPGVADVMTVFLHNVGCLLSKVSQKSPEIFSSKCKNNEIFQSKLTNLIHYQIPLNFCSYKMFGLKCTKKIALLSDLYMARKRRCNSGSTRWRALSGHYRREIQRHLLKCAHLCLPFFCGF